MIYLYNELSALRNEAERLQLLLEEACGAISASNIKLGAQHIVDDLRRRRNAAGAVEDVDPATRALLRRHKAVQVFAICPAPKLAISRPV